MAKAATNEESLSKFEKLAEESARSAPTRCTESDNIADELSLAEKRRQLHEANRPEIMHLEDAIVAMEDGSFILIPQPGEKVIIERKLANGCWLDTKLLRIISIDDETGDIKMYDDECQQYAHSNFITGPASYDYAFKLPPAKGYFGGKRSRRRGRKKGSKNKVKDEVTNVQPKRRKSV